MKILNFMKIIAFILMYLIAYILSTILIYNIITSLREILFFDIFAVIIKLLSIGQSQLESDSAIVIIIPITTSMITAITIGRTVGIAQGIFTSIATGLIPSISISLFAMLYTPFYRDMEYKIIFSLILCFFITIIYTIYISKAYKKSRYFRRWPNFMKGVYWYICICLYIVTPVLFGFTTIFFSFALGIII